MTLSDVPKVQANNEWSPLKSVIVGRAGHACFPFAPAQAISATMPEKYQAFFKPQSPFPERVVSKAEAELNYLAVLLEGEGVQVLRPPQDIDWLAENGYTGAMVRDGLMTVGNTIIEAPFAWPSRSREIEIAYGSILRSLGTDPRVSIVRRSAETFNETLFDDMPEKGQWTINNSRPAFDTADFMRFGSVILGQYSHVTNDAGVQYLRQHLPLGYRVEILEVNDPHAMHIDATLLPLREGLLVYNPQRVTEEALRKHEFLWTWKLVPFPFVPEDHQEPPLFMTSAWLSLNVLVLDGERVVVEASDDKTAAFYESLGMRCIRCPFRHVYSLGGSFHCATVDLVRT